MGGLVPPRGGRGAPHPGWGKSWVNSFLFKPKLAPNSLLLHAQPSRGHDRAQREKSQAPDISLSPSAPREAGLWTGAEKTDEVIHSHVGDTPTEDAGFWNKDLKIQQNNIHRKLFVTFYDEWMMRKKKEGEMNSRTEWQKTHENSKTRQRQQLM